MADHVVNVKEGCLRGTTVKSIVGGSYVAFKGIPFAAPPVGNLRFADPQSPQPWKGVRDASQERSKCIQIDTTTSSVVGDEDCLYLNVTTTSLKGSRPVMVWIHGGGFMTGDASPNMYGPDYLMKTEIVFVSIQYRLGVFGFLQLDHEVVPGNAGLKDQVAALKWVKENIAQFGGDPNNVTIFGESAGSASVHFHLLSPLSKGFFHKAIMQSGVTLNPWIACTVSVGPAHLLAATLGKETTDPHEIVEHLRTVPAEKLLFAQEEACTREDKFHFLVSFRPCVDDKSQQPFMPKLPQDLVENGVDVPVIIGYNTHEGLLSLMCHKEIFALELLRDSFEIAVSQDLIAEDPSKISDVAKEIRDFYFKDEEISKKMINEYVQYYGDIHFVNGILKVVEYHQRKKGPTYLYRFSYDSPKSIGKVVFGLGVEGAAHSDDIPYIFYPAQFSEHLKFEPNSVAQTISNRMIRMWTDFARTGNPTPQIDDLITVKWDPITQTDKNFIEIGTELSAGVNPNQEVQQLFKRISDIVTGKKLSEDKQ